MPNRRSNRRVFRLACLPIVLALGLSVFAQDAREVTKKVFPSAVQIVPPADSGSGEDAFWKEIAAKDTVKDYARYFEEYPKGKYVDLAKARVIEIIRTQEEIDWQKVKEQDSLGGYEAFVNKYPPCDEKGNRYLVRLRGVSEGDDALQKVQINFCAKYITHAEKAIERLEREYERQEWLEAERLGTYHGFSAYLYSHPEGEWAPLARLRLSSLESPQTLRTPFGMELKSFPSKEISERNRWIGSFPVTQGQWREVMGNNPSFRSDCGESCPVENIEMEEILKFIDKLNEREEFYYYDLPSISQADLAAYKNEIKDSTTIAEVLYGECIPTSSKIVPVMRITKESTRITNCNFVRNFVTSRNIRAYLAPEFKICKPSKGVGFRLVAWEGTPPRDFLLRTSNYFQRLKSVEIFYPRGNEDWDFTGSFGREEKFYLGRARPGGSWVPKCRWPK